MEGVGMNFMWIATIVLLQVIIKTECILPPVRACYLNASFSGSLDPSLCTHLILEGTGGEQDGLFGEKDSKILKTLQSAKSQNPTLKLLLSSTPKTLVRLLKTKWTPNSNPRQEWANQVISNITAQGLDGLDIKLQDLTDASEIKQVELLLKELHLILMQHAGGMLAMTVPLDSSETKDGLETLAMLSRYVNMVIFDKTVASLAALPLPNGSPRHNMAQAVTDVKEVLNGFQVSLVVKVPVYEGLRMQALYKQFRQTVNKMKDGSNLRRSRARFPFIKARNAAWKKFQNNACRVSPSGKHIKTTIVGLLKNYPDLGIAAWSLNHDDLTNVCADTTFFFTRHLFSEADQVSNVQRPTSVMAMTKDGPQLYIVQPPKNMDLMNRQRRPFKPKRMGKFDRKKHQKSLDKSTTEGGTTLEPNPDSLFTSTTASPESASKTRSSPSAENISGNVPKKTQRQRRVKLGPRKQFWKPQINRQSTFVPWHPLVRSADQTRQSINSRRRTFRRKTFLPIQTAIFKSGESKENTKVPVSNYEGILDDMEKRYDTINFLPYNNDSPSNGDNSDSTVKKNKYQPRKSGRLDILLSVPEARLVDIWQSHLRDQKLQSSRHRSRRDTTKVGSPCSFKRPIPDPEDCRHYLQCTRGKLYRYNCGQNAVFDPSARSCSSPNSVQKCKGVQTIWKEKNQDTFKCEAEGYYQHPKDCQMFYRCTLRSTHLFRCPDGLGFDSSTATCDNQENIPNCKGSASKSKNGEGPERRKNKISNWRGEMKIREMEVPVFSAHKGQSDDGQDQEREKADTYANNLTNLKKQQERMQGAWKEGTDRKQATHNEVRRNAENWSHESYGGMGIHITEDEEKRVGHSAKDIPHNIDGPELRRIQIWPSVMPTIPASVAPTSPVSTKSTHRPKPVNGKEHAKQLPMPSSPTYNNLDIVHFQTDDEYSSKKDSRRNKNEGAARRYQNEENERRWSPRPTQPGAHFNDRSFTEPPHNINEHLEGLSRSEWPNHVQDGWLGRTGGVSIAIARNFQCPSDGYFRDPKSCMRFYHCSHGLPYHVQCTGGLVFNPRNRICDWKKSMPECENYLDVSDTDAKTFFERKDNKTRRGNEECTPGTVRRHWSNCNMFHVCSAVAVEYQFRCPSHLAFDDRSRRCVPRHLVGYCKNNQDLGGDYKEGILDDPSDSEDAFHCPTTYGFYRDSENCSRFYECAFWIPFKMSCPKGSLFSAEHRRCEHENRVLECLPGGAAWKVAQEMQEKKKQQSLRQDSTMLVFKCTQNGRFRDPTDCQLFHECDDAGNHAQYKCPSAMVFNPKLGLCDLPHNVPSCLKPPQQQQARSRYDIQKSAGPPPQERPTSSPSPQPQVQTFDHMWGSELESDEDSDLDIRQMADRPLISPRVPRHMAGKIQLKQTGLPCQGDSVFHNPSDCTQFFWCYKNKLVRNTCPDPLVFNTESYQCDMFEFVPRCAFSPSSSAAPPPTSPSPTFTLRRPTDQPQPSYRPTEQTPYQAPQYGERRPVNKVYKNLDQEVQAQPQSLRSEEQGGLGDSWDELDKAYVNSVDSFYSLEEGGDDNQRSQYEDTQGPSVEFQCPGDGFFRDPGNCAHFYYCKDGWRYKYACAEGRAFDEQKKFCNWTAYVPGC